MKKYWQSLDEYNDIPDSEKESSEKEHKNAVLELFDENVSGSRSSRRDFLKLLGFSVSSAALLASCEKPVQKAIPYVIAPEEIIPGQATYYASSYFDGKDFCNIVVKTRDGRPIKIEGNEMSSFNKSGTTARVQASVLSLYDDSRIKFPVKSNERTRWDEIDDEIRLKLSELDSDGRSIVLLSSNIISPSTKQLIAEFGDKYENFRHITYEAVSHSGILNAAEISYGKALIPDYRFENADMIVSFAADFLGSWLVPVHFIPAYVSRRKLDEGQRDMLYHVQLESSLSLTGSNADKRILIKPSEEKLLLVNLYNELASGSEAPSIKAETAGTEIREIAGRLYKAGNRGLVISGSNDPECQLLVNSINYLLGNTGVTLDYKNPLHIASGNDGEMERLIEEMESGETGAVMMYQVNPLYDYPHAPRFAEALKKTGMSISFSSASDESSLHTGYICPDHHYLESWNDAEILPGRLSLTQPCIHPLFDTRSFQDSLLRWMNHENDFHSYIKNHWREKYFPGVGDFDDWWNECLQKGVYEADNLIGQEETGFHFGDIVERSISAVNQNIRVATESGLEMILQETVQMGDGRHANNPWLQELPDPVSKICWENVLLLAPSDAIEKELRNGDIVEIAENVEIPVLIQAGQASGTCTLALGYGRKHTGKVADGKGINAYPFVRIVNGNRIYYSTGMDPVPTGKKVKLALTQTHNSMEERPIIRTTSLEDYLKKPDSGNELHEEFESHHKTLYPEMKFVGFHWGLAVDLNACVGCSACVIACQAENNIPVVGKEEVHNRRIMHWIKIDRYYTGEPENPEVLFQPVMCQHCDNAPCENVCPVSATNHSVEGINQMSYNRCIGTKYCINNCPYRVRRFNWYQYTGNKEFDYHINSDLGKMVLNPDVVVRERGVVEKCSFCVQRIQEKKLQAKIENRTLKDGEVQPACVQACPAGALIFGDLKSKDSKVSGLFNDPRNYHLLEQLHTLPSVGYLTKVKNTPGNSRS